MGAKGTEVVEAGRTLHRADDGAEPKGSKGSGASPCQTAVFNTASADRQGPKSRQEIT